MGDAYHSFHIAEQGGGLTGKCHIWKNSSMYYVKGDTQRLIIHQEVLYTGALFSRPT